MKKEIIQYSTPVDALVAVAKRLSLYESRNRMISEEFFDRYEQGRMEDSAEYVEWANDYRHYLAIRSEIEKQLSHVA